MKTYFYFDIYINCGSKIDFLIVIGRLSIEKLPLCELGLSLAKKLLSYPKVSKNNSQQQKQEQEQQ